jgi:hypothetical protein
MKKLIFTVFSVLSLGLLSAQAQSRAQIIHNSSDALLATADIYVGGSLFLDDVAFRTATPFIEILPAGGGPLTVDVEIAPGNSSSNADAVASFQVTFVDGETYVIVAHGISATSAPSYNPAPALSLDIYTGQETAITPGNTEFLVVHGATDAPMVDVVALGAGTLVDDMDYLGSSGSYISVPNADYQVQVRNAAGNLVVAQYAAPLASLGLADSAIVVLASGFLDPSVNNNGPAFGLWVAKPEGGSLIPLPSGAITTARLQAIHNCASPAASVVDVWLNNTKIIDDFAFRTASPFVDVPAGSDFDISIALPTSTDTVGALARFTYNLPANGSFIAIASGTVGTGFNPAEPFNLEVFAGAREASTTAGNNDVLVFHGVTDAPGVNVYVPATGDNLVDSLYYSDFDGYVSLPADDYQIQVRTVDGTIQVAEYSAPLLTLGITDQAITVLASGFLDPSQNANGPAFGLWATTAAGGPLLELPSLPLSTARVQVIHNSADLAAANVDVWVNDELAIDNFAFRTASEFVDVPAGTSFDVVIQPANSIDTTNALARFTYTLPGGEKFILVANGIVSPSGYSPATPFDIDVYTGAREIAEISGNTDVLVYHGSTDAPPVDVREATAGLLVNNISYSEFSNGYLELPTADYTVQVFDSTSTTNIVSYQAPLATLSLQDEALVVLASGFLDPSVNSNGPGFGLWVALTDGGNLIPLPLITGIRDVEAGNGINLYPVPANNTLNIAYGAQNNERASFRIFSLDGKTMMQGDWFPNSNINVQTLDISNLASGMYSIEVLSGDFRNVSRFVVSK